MIRGNCPLCGRAYKVDDRYAGKVGRCKACGATVTVPGVPAADGGGHPPGPPQPPPAASTPPPSTGPRIATQSVDASQAGTPQAPAPAAPSQPTPAEPQQPVRRDPEGPRAHSRPGTDELESTHDARSRYEPREGPTALAGSWVKEEPAGAEAESEVEEPPERPEPVVEQPQEGLASDRLVTTIDGEEARTRPALVAMASVVLCLLGAGFCVFSALRAGPLGAVVGAIALILAGLAVWRLWTAHWDGMVPGFLCVVCVLAAAGQSAMPRDGVPGELHPALIAFVAGALLALLLLIAALLRDSCRAYFGS